MFNEIDKTIFADSCEVLQTSSQQFLYPIFKNGRSSFRIMSSTPGWKYLDLDTIKTIKDPFIVFLRDPKERFISGVNTYLQHLKNENPDLDTKTILFFVNRYLFLNRHYCPQFFWLINLAKHTSSDVRMQFKAMSGIAEMTPYHCHAMIEPPGPEFLKSIADFNWSQLELYFYLDQLLIDRIGQELTFRELCQIIKTEYPEVYQLVFNKSIDLINVLS